MSATLEQRVLAVHPLSPAHRMVLFWMARQVPDGATEVLVNRSAVAREMECGTDMVARALAAGREVGLCRVLQNGRIAFTGYDGTFERVSHEEVALALGAKAVSRPAVQVVEPSAEVPKPSTTTGMVFMAFGKRWTARYKQRFVVADPSYPRLARALCALTPTELDERMDRYFSDPDQFWSDCKHSFGSFARNVHRFVPDVKVAGPKRREMDADKTQAYLARLRNGGAAK